MTVQDFLKENTLLLARHGIATARLDCIVILEDILHKNRTHLLAYPEQPLTESQISKLQQYIQRRLNHEPLAYIRGHMEFYGRDFNVDKRVLIPRPESEALIDILRSFICAHKEVANIVDIGTGSGALAITAKHYFPSLEIIATDVSTASLEVARLNAALHCVSLTYISGSLLEAVPLEVTYKPTAFLCNLPYVPRDHPISIDACSEPQLAIFAGDHGLELYRLFFTQLSTRAPSHGSHVVITESLRSQHSQVASIARQHSYSLLATEGLAQCFTSSS